MTRSEIHKLLRAGTFRPFRIEMNHARRFDVHHPEMAFVGSGVLYLFDAARSDDQDVAGLNAICAIHNVSHIEFLNSDVEHAS